MTLSDRNAILIEGSLHPLVHRASRWQFNTTLLCDSKYIAQLISGLQEFIDINSVDDPRILWDAIKWYCTLGVIPSFTHLPYKK